MHNILTDEDKWDTSGVDQSLLTDHCRLSLSSVQGISWVHTLYTSMTCSYQCSRNWQGLNHWDEILSFDTRSMHWTAWQLLWSHVQRLRFVGYIYKIQRHERFKRKQMLSHYRMHQVQSCMPVLWITWCYKWFWPWRPGTCPVPMMKRDGSDPCANDEERWQWSTKNIPSHKQIFGNICGYVASKTGLWWP